MKFDEFTTKFQKSEEKAGTGAPMPASLPCEVLLAGTVVSATGGACRLSVNGVQYDIAPADIIDVQLLSSMTSAKGEAADIKKVTDTDVVVLKMNSNAILYSRIPVQASLVAAAGMWVTFDQAAAAQTARDKPAEKRPGT